VLLIVVKLLQVEKKLGMVSLILSKNKKAEKQGTAKKLWQGSLPINQASTYLFTFL